MPAPSTWPPRPAPSPRLSGNRSYAATADASLDPATFDAELAYMKNTVARSQYDNPYRFAWFLLLAQEREQVTGRADLRPLADYAASQIALKLPGMNPLSPSYGSGSWAAMRLNQWMAGFVLSYQDPGSLTAHQRALDFTASYAIAVIAKASGNGPLLDSARAVTARGVADRGCGRRITVSSPTGSRRPASSR